MKDPVIMTENFSSWLDETRQAQKTGKGMNVPCGDCTACCTSSYFIHINSHETVTKSMIPKKLMFPAPGLSKGNVLLGFNENGHCPMFTGNKCSIYDCRPHTCRTYDCRVIAAAGLHPGDDKPLIFRQVNRWKFNFSGKGDMVKFSAVRAAAEFISRHAGSFPAGFIPVNPPQQAMTAVKIYEVFLEKEGDSEIVLRPEPDEKIIKAIIDVYEKFQAVEKV